MDFSLGGCSEADTTRMLKQCRPISELEEQQPLKMVKTEPPTFSGRQEFGSSAAEDHHHQQQQQQQQQSQLYDPHGMMYAPQMRSQMGYSPSHFVPIKQQYSSLNSSPASGAGAASFPYYPFTASQWAELEHQALIFKYMMARAPVPPELVNPFRRSLILSPNTNSFQLGVSTGSPMDAEPGRCRRTDGKKWRCSRPIVADQKYCERHIHRGRNRSRKAAEAAAAAVATAAQVNTSAVTTNNINNNNNNGNVGSVHQPSNGSTELTTKATTVAPVFEQKSTAAVSNSHSSSSKFFLDSSGYHLQDSVLSSGKDQRFVNGMSKDQFDLRPEQLLFSEVSGSCTRQQQQQLRGRAEFMQPAASLYSCDTILDVSSGMRREQPEAAALRHFFVNDWPGRGGASSKNENSWCTDEEEGFGSLKLALENKKKNSGQHEDEDDTYTNISLARINSAGGGDLLADVLKSTPSSLKPPTSSFNLSGYNHGGKTTVNSSQQQQQQQQQMILASPTGVLQKVTCFSDSSSSASSPGSVKNETSHAH